MKRHNKSFRASLLAMVALALPCIHAQQEHRAVAPSWTKLTAAELTQARQALKSTLPAQATDASVQPSQAMRMNRDVLVPVIFRVPVPDAIVAGATRTECGLYLATAGTAPTFVPTAGTGVSETVECGSLKAIGASNQAPRPDLILIYDVHTMRNDFLMPLLLAWNGKTYAVDDARSQWLGEHKQAQTIAGARRMLTKAAGPGTTDLKGK